jgi:hypothetical protein
MDEDLADLRWHYSGAYVITHPAPDVWLAQRCDDDTTLRADTPDALRDLIRVDYGQRPVPRVTAALWVAKAARRWT